MGREWLSLRQVTQYAALSERTIRGWIHSPVAPLPAIRIRGKILVRRSDLDAWFERHRIARFEKLDLDGIVEDVLQGLVRGYRP